MSTGTEAQRAHPAAHHELVTIRRGLGQSAVARVAYVTRARIRDLRTGVLHNYARVRRDLVSVHVVGTDLDPSQVAHAMEAAEKRRDAQVGRSSIIALPEDVSGAARERIVLAYCDALRARYGGAYVAAIHAPHDGPDGPARNGARVSAAEPRSRNFHVHLVETTRQIDETGTLGAKLSVLSNPRTSGAEVSWRRQTWAQLCNAELARAEAEDGVPRLRVDPRSIEARKAAGELPEEYEAARHRGPALDAALRRKERREDERLRGYVLTRPEDIRPPVDLPAYADVERARAARAEVKRLEKAVAATEALLADLCRLAALALRLEQIGARLAADVRSKQIVDRVAALMSAPRLAEPDLADGAPAAPPVAPAMREASAPGPAPAEESPADANAYAQTRRRIDDVRRGYPMAWPLSARDAADTEKLRRTLARVPNLKLRASWRDTLDVLLPLDEDPVVQHFRRGLAALEAEARARGFDLDTGHHDPRKATDPDRATLHTDELPRWQRTLRRTRERQRTR